MPRINMRRATTVGLTSFATLTLVPLLAQAKPSERALLLLAAVPAAVFFGYLAGYAAGSVTHLDAGQLQDIQLRAAQLQAAQRSASTTVPSGAPVIRLISEPIPQPETGSPIGSGHLAALARPPAGQPASRHRDGLHLVPAPSREASTTGSAAKAAAEAAPNGLSGSDPHLTLIVTHPTR
ncbi:hypothetical protein FHR75_004426 [Kineococcus radiotolerans]|uniref:Uncharacterized protein n=1 Tax=Kineococcus radiotolerans TaxID=131568 RepID=A0A7W4TRV5_KINRA|nr:hypothetical protein [Kineococcus radiotolerans]MBB2903583.1 hypothetical protein [Kineococcus radiotolerans]